MVLTPAYAEEETPDPEASPEPEASVIPEETPEPEPAYSVNAQSAVLVDMTSGNVLFEQDKDKQLDPASLTKLMTVYLATENLSPQKELTMSAEAFETYDHSFGVLWFEQGETMTAESVEYAAMIASANDAAAMLAEGVSANQAEFINRMNNTASSLGMNHTNYQNPFGIHNAENYSSAHDTALLLRKAMQNEQFRTLFGAPSYSIPPTNLTGVSRNLVNDCALLRKTGYYLETVTGGKIGNTADGGFSLAATAKQNGMELIAVVLGEQNADLAYKDIASMFEYGFTNFQSVSFSSADIGEKFVEVYKNKKHVADIHFTVSSDYHVLLPAGLDASTMRAEAVVNNETETNPDVITADVVFYLDDLMVGTAPMNKEVTLYDTSAAATLGPTARLYFDYACIGVLALFILRIFLKMIHRLLAPPA